MSVPQVSRRLVPGLARGLDENLSRHQRGGGDPSHRRRHGVWWRATTTPTGTALLQFTPDGADVEVLVWGEGAAWALEQAPRLVGARDAVDAIGDEHPLRTHPVLRPLTRSHLRSIGASDLVAEALAPSILEQKVTGAEAFRAIHRLVRQYGTPAPGPASASGRATSTHPAAGMICPPSAEQWAAIPSWAYLRSGVEPRRAQTLVRALGRAGSLQRLLDRHADEPAATAGTALDRALQSLPGVGPWTSAKVRQAAAGDPDAWSVDDYHVPGWISWALTGVRGDSAAAEAAMASFVGHRYRVELVLAHAGVRPERHGPRRSLPTHLP